MAASLPLLLGAGPVEVMIHVAEADGEPVVEGGEVALGDRSRLSRPLPGPRSA